MNFWNRSLLGRLVVYFLVLTIVSLGIISYIAFLQARATLTNSVYERLNAVVSVKEGEVTRWVNDQAQQVALFANSPDMRSSASTVLSAPLDEDVTQNPRYAGAYQRLSNYLNAVQQSTPNLQEIFLLTDIGGKIIVSTQKNNEGQFRVTDSYFTRGRLETYVQNVYPSPVTGRPTLTVSTPVYNSQGLRIGVLAAHINLERLNAVILNRAGLGLRGETYLVDQFNNFISEARFGENAFPRGVSTIGIDAAISGRDGQDAYNNYEQTPVLGVYRWLEDLQVAMLAEIPATEALLPAQQFALTVFFIGLAILVLTSGAMFFVARQIAQPILAINAAALQVADGDFSQAAPVMTDDEIGTLAQSFNRMTTQLGELYGELEQKVAARTKDLEQRANQLRAIVEVGRAAASLRDIDELLDTTTKLISEQFDFYHVGIFILDPSGEYAVLRAANSPGGQRMLQRGHRLRVGQEGIVGFVTRYRQPRIAMDVGRDAVFFNNPDLPQTRSEMALPLVASGNLLGALDVQSKQPAAFTNEDITILQALADQVAVAIENARLFAESQTALETSRRAYGELSRQSWETLLRESQIGFSAGPVGLLPLRDAAQNTDANLPALQVPIQVRETTIGYITAHKPISGGEWKEDEVQLLKVLSRQLSLTLEGARLLIDAQRRAHREQLVSGIISQMRETLDIDTILQNTLQQLGDRLGIPEVEIRLAGQQRTASITSTSPSPTPVSEN
ncbi:MAG: hypothetical protein OHK0052_00100 [Anaerolineales bacterium]